MPLPRGDEAGAPYGPVSGCQAPPEVIVVHATGETTRDGQPVFADAAGTFRVEIVADIARPLATIAGPGCHTILRALPLP
ncbi:DUF6296 family protein [Kitasatospora sp. NPDC058444]|uniref:DUF6296 family protein n=1 Tax=Kitasatospora sp. NPDC058444 TaxID=3346504 RepID=UPI00364C12F9